MLAINLKYKVGGKEEKFLSPTHPGREDSLGVGMATHSSILSWERQRDLVGNIGSQRVRRDLATKQQQK